MDYNKVILIGRLGKDPEQAKSGSGIDIARFPVATSKKEKTEWHNVVCFRKTAEFAGAWLKKGDLVQIEGEISYSIYEKEGVKKVFTNIIANLVNKLSKKSESSELDNSSAFKQKAPGCYAPVAKVANGNGVKDSYESEFPF